MVCSVTSLSPGLTYWPGLMVVMPSLPAKGARMIFLSTSACCCATSALRLFRSALSLSSWAWLMASAASCCLSRASTVADKSAAACSECSWAMSESAFISNSTSLALTSSPDLNFTVRTRPAISLVTSTPRTGASVPTEVSCGCHSSVSALAAVTVWAPGLGALAIKPWICLYLPNARTAISSNTQPTMMSIRLVMKLSPAVFDSDFEASIGFGRRQRRLRLHQLAPVPPAAAQRLEQRGRVGVARRLRLHQRDVGLLVGALGVEQRQIADRAELVLRRRQRQRLRGQRFGLGLRLQRAGVGIERAQAVGNVLEGAQQRDAVLRRRRVVGRFGRVAFGRQRAAVEDRLRQSGAKAPDDVAGLEDLRWRQRLRTVAAAERKLRILVGGGHADQCAGLMQLLFAGADVGPLAHQRRRQGHRQFLRQGQRVEFKFRNPRFARQLAGQHRQLVARLCQRFFQRRHGGHRLRQLGALGQQGRARNGAELELLVDQAGLLGQRVQHLVRGLELRA